MPGNCPHLSSFNPQFNEEKEKEYEEAKKKKMLDALEEKWKVRNRKSLGHLKSEFDSERLIFEMLILVFTDFQRREGDIWIFLVFLWYLHCHQHSGKFTGNAASCLINNYVVGTASLSILRK